MNTNIYKMKSKGVLIISVAALLLLSGCSTGQPEKQVRNKPLEDKLSRIDTVKLVDQSISEPVTIEQATEQLIKEVNEPNQPVRTIELTLEQVRAAALAKACALRQSK